jgi:hypothetical protein
MRLQIKVISLAIATSSLIGFHIQSKAQILYGSSSEKLTSNAAPNFVQFYKTAEADATLIVKFRSSLSGSIDPFFTTTASMTTVLNRWGPRASVTVGDNTWVFSNLNGPAGYFYFNPSQDMTLRNFTISDSRMPFLSSTHLSVSAHPPVTNNPFAWGNKNAQSVGAALTKLGQAYSMGETSTQQDDLIHAIYHQATASNIQNYAQSLAGEIYPAAVAARSQATQRTQESILSRLSDNIGIGLPLALDADSSKKITGEKTSSNSKAWGNLAYQKGNRSRDHYSGGWNSSLYQLVFGSDWYKTNGIQAGGGFTLSSTTLNPTHGSGTIQQGSLFVYGKMPVYEYVLDAIASVGLSSSDLYRNDETGGPQLRNKNISGNEAMVSLGVSRPIDLGTSTRLTPYARITWQILTQSSIDEGDALPALNVNSFTGNGIRGVLGMTIGSKTTDPLKEQYTYRAFLGVGADSPSLLNPTMNASLAGFNTSISTPNAGATFVQAGLYGTAKIGKSTYAYAGISGEARNGQTLGALNAGLRIHF